MKPFCRACLLFLLLCSTLDPALAAPPCTPLETRAANAAGQHPARPDQTRACAVATVTPLAVSVVASGLERPWAVEPLPDGRFVVTEKPGRMRLVAADGRVGPALAGLPAVDARGQGGLLDVAIGPGFASDRTLWWSYAEARAGGNATSVARGVLAAGDAALEDVRVILRTEPAYDGDKHFGSRLVFGTDGMLYVTLGERSDRATRPQAQALDSHLGKVLRIAPDGSVPADNPYAGRAGARPEIYTLGHRNVQAAALDARGRLWVVEHGTQGGDELNLLAPGANYGWPRAAYGEEYIGLAIKGAKTQRAETVQPVYYWDPVIAPSGAQFHSGRGIPEWAGNLFVGGLKDGVLVRLVLADDRVVGEEHLLAERGRRVRDVREGPDGALYVVTDERDGELLRIAPKQ
ncbi:MAG TPA: PQQ-dependent sugar dehydrogenase [Gammaproteobacteria bacterium]|nr:PQQ-dependent sugar dehydrogenase [Gammaproteobacteria bacterium]